MYTLKKLLENFPIQVTDFLYRSLLFIRVKDLVSILELSAISRHQIRTTFRYLDVREHNYNV